MKKIYTLVLLLIICLIGSAFACSGEDSDFKVAFDSSIKYAEAVYNEECDLSDYVDMVNGYEYYIEAVQVDVENDMETVNLKCNGLTFIPTILDDAYVTLYAKKGDKVFKSIEVKIPVGKPSDKVVEKIFTAWKDQNFTTTINTIESYIHGDKSTSAKIEWMGSEPSYKDRWQYFTTLMGDDITNAYSLTSWEDAVLSFWVYNPTEADIEISPVWTHTGADLILENDPRTIQVAKAGQWTEIKYSLAYFGIQENFYYDEAVYSSYVTERVQYGIGTADNGKQAINQNWWTCRWANRKDTGKVYNYVFYVSNFDIRNYDSNLDSELNHTLRAFNSDFKFAEGNLVEIGDIAKSKDILSFDVQTMGTGKCRFCAITEDWQQYVGYFEFDIDDSSKNSPGVTVEQKQGDSDTFIVTVDLSYGALNGGASKETVFNNIYFYQSECSPFIGNISVTEGTQSEDEEKIVTGVTKTFASTVANPTSVSFEYKLEAKGDSTKNFNLCLLDGEGENYYGYFTFCETAPEYVYAGVSYEEGVDGYIVVTIDIASVDRYNHEQQSPVPSIVVAQLYIRGEWTNVNGSIKNIIWS